jgi:hypothetical protein
MLRNKEEVVRRLTEKPVPRAVRWYDPGVLVHVGLRHVMSETIGEYADQRLIQAATDNIADKDKLVQRYDFYTDPERLRGPDGAWWVDYVADVGDGFGPTFGMASLLAQDELQLANMPLGEKLPAARLLVLGGDQCYPQATHDEYEERFVLPYATALPPRDDKEPPSRPGDGKQRKERLLFALPGNHDWYDGLGAFDHLFCQNRDPLLGREFGRRIGGWRCQQHRSYWAIRLPHNWWIWGVDIQFSKYLDAAQESYFRTVVDLMAGGGGDSIEYHNVILCIAEPHWLNAEFEGIDSVDSLHTLVRIAQRSAKDPLSPNREVRVRAVLAGDWHHYSHYSLDDLHDPQAKPGSGPALQDQGIHLITAGGGGAFLHSTTDLRKDINVSWGVRPDGDTPAEQPAATSASKGQRRRPRRFTGKARMVACYPGRGRSTLLSLKNLAFPLRNWRFALVIGALYWIMTWQYHVVVKTVGSLKPLNSAINNAELATIDIVSDRLLMSLPTVAAEDIFYSVLLLALWFGLVAYVPVSEKRTPLFRGLVRFGVGSLHALAHLKVMFVLFVLLTIFNGSTEFAAFHWLLYPVEMAVFGGLLGGFVFGAYWVLTGLIARMHTGDSFGALGIRNYKNFLRMRFDGDSLTIYPIGVDRLPSTKWCNQQLEKNPPNLDSNPLLAIKPLKPFLIRGRDEEGEKVAKPIVIPRIPQAAPRPAAQPAKVAAE